MRSAKVALGQALTRHPIPITAFEAVRVAGVLIKDRLGLLLRREV